MKDNVQQALIDAAKAVQPSAHAPYSQFRVGAAVRMADGTTVVGVNLENVSYGLTVCAERNALAAAAAAGAKPGHIVAVAIVADDDRITPPCGACRQVLAELLDDETPIWMHNLRTGRTEEATLAQLLPRAFRVFHPNQAAGAKEP